MGDEPSEVTVTIEYANAPAFYFPLASGYLPGESVDVGSGNVAIKKPNGKWLSVQPNGSYEDRDAVGPWETFTPDTKSNTLRVHVVISTPSGPDPCSPTYVVAFRAV